MQRTCGKNILNITDIENMNKYITYDGMKLI